MLIGRLMAAVIQRWVRLGLIGAIAIGLQFSWVGGAIALPLLPLASIHTYHERPDQTTYRSRLTLPDRRDRAWQATLFHRYRQGEDQGIYLRLVAYPGSAVVAKNEPLTVSTGGGWQWLAAASQATLPANPPENLGQYAFNEVLAQIATPIPLTLSVPLAGGRPQQLVVAPYVVEEWQALAAMAEPTDSSNN